MSLNVAESISSHRLEENCAVDVGQEQSMSWTDRMMQSIARTDVQDSYKVAATVHPCIINGERVLVHERGMARAQPDAYSKLKEFARENGFQLKEDKRTRSTKVGFERRMAKTMPLLFLASGIFCQGVVQAETVSKAEAGVDVQQMPEITVKGERQKSRFERDYQMKDGKRFVSDPYGDIKSILRVAKLTKEKGQSKRVSTRRITMPQNYVGGSIERHVYQFPESCGGAKFSYFEGDGFGALGYHHGKKIILDVMVGGGPFASPKLWGPYDQVLGDRHNVKMKLMMGNGQQDGMGLLKASYAIGMMPQMSKKHYAELGNAYVNAVRATAECSLDNEPTQDPVIRQAKLETHDAS